MPWARAAEPLRIDTGLHGRDLRRLAEGLAEPAVPARLDGRFLVFDDVAFGKQAENWIEKFTDYNRRIHQRARREGRPLERYKPLDEADLILAVCRGLLVGDAAAVAHEVVWRQPFPNANHRSAVAVLIDEMGLRAAPEELRRVTNPLFRESKALLDGSDATPTVEAKQRHYQLWCRIIDALQSMR